ncbi:MAG: hypothetical protein R3Y63_09590 [Eubacteriales bacterium]
MDKETEKTSTESVETPKTDVPKKKSKLNFQNPLVSMSVSAVCVAGGFFAYQHFFVPETPPPSMEVMDANVQVGLNGKSREEILAELEAAAAENSISFAINALVPFKDGSKTGNITFENKLENQKYLMLELILDATGESIYSSDLVQPGSQIATCTLSKALEKGQHSCTAMIYAFRLDDQSFIGQAAAGLILDVT